MASGNDQGFLYVILALTEDALFARKITTHAPAPFTPFCPLDDGLLENIRFAWSCSPGRKKGVYSRKEHRRGELVTTNKELEASLRLQP